MRVRGQPFPAYLKALEIGCGPGRIMRPLSTDFAEIHGIDVSDEMISLAREKLRGIPNAYVYHTSTSDLSSFPGESFDFVYSYAVFQHIPSREVVLGYLADARRVLKPGGILRCQINGLPETFARYNTWDGVRIPAPQVADFAVRHDFQLYALENVDTQYLWTTWRKRPVGWRARLRDALRPVPAPAACIRIISNALTADPLVPASGPRAFAALRIENLPADCDLINLEVLIDGRPGALSYLAHLSKMALRAGTPRYLPAPAPDSSSGSPPAGGAADLGLDAHVPSGPGSAAPVRRAGWRQPAFRDPHRQPRGEAGL